MCTFRESADPAAFQSFYSLSRPLLEWYAGRLLGGEEGGEREAILTRFYAFLFEEALSPAGRLPVEDLLGWCKAALAHLVELHRRGEVEEGEAGGVPLGDRIRPLPNEIGLRERMLPEAERVSEGVLEVLVRGDAGLTGLEGEVLTAFYREGRDLSGAAEKCGLDEELTRRVLGCARSKVYLAFLEGPGRYLTSRPYDDAARVDPGAGEVEG